MNPFVISYILRLIPAIFGFLGAIINSVIIFYIGRIICFSLHIIFLLRQSLRPIIFIILIYLGALFIFFINRQLI